MARTRKRPVAANRQTLVAIQTRCPTCGNAMWADYDNRRSVTTLDRIVHLTQSLLSATGKDLGQLLQKVKCALSAPVMGVISDGQHSIRNAVQKVLSGMPHPLCQFHYLREAARPIFEADRHAKKELKKRIRGVRPIERKIAGRSDAEAKAVKGYCAAVRSSIADDGRPPLAASGLKLHGRVRAIRDSIDRVRPKGGLQRMQASSYLPQEDG